MGAVTETEIPLDPHVAQMLTRLQGLKLAPTPEEADEFAIEFDRLYQVLSEATAEAKTKVENALVPVTRLKRELIELVRNFGGPHREKSKLLHGIAWELMATFSQSTTQDGVAVERLRLALKKKKQTKLLKKLFTEDKRWTFSSNAAEILKGEKLTLKIMALVLQCFVTTDRTPTLDVRPKKKAA
jgi:hypothetical protein